MTCWLTDWQTGWLTDRLTDLQTDQLTDRLTDWLTDLQTDWLTDWLTDRQTDWLTYRLTNNQTDQQPLSLPSSLLHSLSPTNQFITHKPPWSWKIHCLRYLELHLMSHFQEFPVSARRIITRVYKLKKQFQINFI